MVFFFFFQAEDGIRDADVTGVQTCALPISGQVESFQTLGVDERFDWGDLPGVIPMGLRSEEHTSELQSRPHLVCRLLLEKKNWYLGSSAQDIATAQLLTARL